MDDQDLNDIDTNTAPTQGFDPHQSLLTALSNTDNNIQSQPQTASSPAQMSFIRPQVPMGGVLPWLIGKMTGKQPMQYAGEPIAVVNQNPNTSQATELGLPDISPVGTDSKGNPLYAKGDIERQQAQIANMKLFKDKQDYTNPQLTDDMMAALKNADVKGVKAAWANQHPNQPIPDKIATLLAAFSNAKSHNTSSNAVTHIGNDAYGNPIMASKDGTLTVNGKPYQGQILPKSSTQATAQTRSSAEFAQSLLPHLDKMEQLVETLDQKGLLGPANGRFWNNFLAGKVGSTGDPATDQALGEFRAFDGLIKTGAMKAHFGSRGGQQMYDHFNDLINGGKQSKAEMLGALSGIRSFMNGYVDAGRSPIGVQTPPSQAPNTSGWRVVR